MTAPDAILLAAGVLCWALAICLLALRVRALNVRVNDLSGSRASARSAVDASPAVGRPAESGDARGRPGRA